MEPVFLIVGLGNPGREYEQTRHNAGFLLLDALAERWRAGWKLEKKFDARVARAERDGRRLFLGKPVTYMNASGEAAGALVKFHKVPLAQVLVAVDDADLPLGTLRLRPDGRSGGHHGLESVEQHLGTRAYARLRIGIGRRVPDQREISDWVLAPFRKEEAPVLEKVLQTGCEQVECWLATGVREAMNRFNGAVTIDDN